MAAAKVKANYEQLQDIAKTFGENADSLSIMKDMISNQVDTLQGGDWEGVGARNFYGEMGGMMMPAFTKLINAMNAAQKTANDIAKTMKQAEEDSGNMLIMRG
ncbi:MAG: WXG100 family type VII secretion target [Anaerolineae bacterium]|nr:WXG100 family type VII secretion target [Anaerolineae bacterium]